ncbi:hypothetical protein [Streptomyces sp. NRRL WC-3742]|uniref:hypothetical protein n=1 Tax=Streptomyces sp. NRRL WC-3742 TaxID=1463934 RepID=UPI0004C54E49|nr:hypothetical protein [Streptomyces sp. NRRL WC-3742]
MTEYTHLEELLTVAYTERVQIKDRAAQFLLGRIPETQEEVAAETKLRETERRWEVEREDRKHRADLESRETERRWEVELEDRKHRADLQSRETERRWEVELEDRKHRADLVHQHVSVTRRAEGIRGWALVAVVVAIVVSPWVAMIANVPANNFSMYMVPVTGIAGTIIGYWFGQGDRLRPATLEALPQPPPLDLPATKFQEGSATARQGVPQ